MREYHYPRAVVALFSGALWLLCGPARAAVVENLSCDLGAIRFTIPRIEATGTALSDADFRGIVDPASAATLSERLGALNAASIVAPQVILEIKAGPASNKITYRDLKLANVACVGGSWMVPAAALAAQDWSRIERLAAAAAALKRP